MCLVSATFDFAIPWTVACQAPLSMGFSRQEYWRGLPGPSAGDLPHLGLNPGLLHCRQILYHLSHQGSPKQYIRSDQISRSVVSDSLQPHESQHARPPCPSPTPGVHSDSCPSSQWWHPAISSSVVPSPLAPNPSQHQSLFQWVNSSHEVAKVLEFQL